MLAGGALAAVAVATPPATTGSGAIVLATGGLAAAVGVGLLLAPRQPGEPVLALVVLLGTVLITIATHEGGFAGVASTDNQMLYIWVCLISFFFFPVRLALLELAAVGLAYGWLLFSHDTALADAATRWIVTMTSLLVAGALVAQLRRANDALIGELSDRARVDPLTGLLNRRALTERAETEFARARRGKGPVAILVVDVDGFKTINDSLGHPAGDHVLRRISAVLLEETRDVDAVARVGGDEFAVLLPGTTASTARTVAERLRVAVRRSAGDIRLRLSVSVGIAVGPPDGNSLDGLWKAADRAMYHAKRAGGDAVASAGELEGAVPPPLLDPVRPG